MIRNEENNQTGENEEFELPISTNLLEKLTAREGQVVIALLEKKPRENWERVAKKIGISPRHLFNIRQSENVQRAYFEASREMLKSDAPDVLKKLTEKAKKGDNASIKLFLEVVGLLKKDNIQPQPSHVNFITSANRPFTNNLTNDLREYMEELEKLTPAELNERLQKQLKLAHFGILPSKNGEKQG